jgi:putative transposase
LDSRSVKTTEVAGAISGYDVAKGVKGRKRHLLVDPSGLVLSALVSPASTLSREPHSQTKVELLLISRGQ